MQYLKQSTAVTLKIGPFLDDTDGKTVETGLAIAQADVRLSKNGANIAQKTEATSCTHDELGIYGCPVDATDTATLGRLQLWVHESGALPVWQEYMILPANVYDSMFSTDKLEVDLLQMGGVAQSATDLKDFTDTGYDPSAHRTQALIKATDDIDLSATQKASVVVAVWDEILTGATHNIATSAGRRLRQIGALNITDGTAQAGMIHSITLAAGESPIDHIFNRNLLVLLAGAGAGQTRTIVDYNGTTKVAVVDRDWWILPDNTSEYSILADDTPLVVDHGVAQDGGNTTITIRSSASSTNNTYIGGIITILAGTGAGQARLIDGYNGTTKVVTICDAWTTNPNTTSVYVIMPYGASRTGCISDTALTQLAAAVWDELQSGHTDVGTYGKYLDVAISSVDCIVGSGALSCTWTQKDEGGTPMDNVNVWISTDESGSNVIAGTLVTNVSGEVIFMLDAGSYYVWRERGGYNFTNPQSWTVS